MSALWRGALGVAPSDLPGIFNDTVAFVAVLAAISFGAMAFLSKVRREGPTDDAIAALIFFVVLLGVSLFLLTTVFQVVRF